MFTLFFQYVGAFISISIDMCVYTTDTDYIHFSITAIYTGMGLTPIV